MCAPTTQLFLGTLREAEVEMIRDRLSHAIMETCLAMTIFQREFNAEFVVFFTLLAFVKVLHWLLQDRLEFLETTPHVSRLQHARIVAFMVFLLVCRIFLLWTHVHIFTHVHTFTSTRPPTHLHTPTHRQ